MNEKDNVKIYNNIRPAMTAGQYYPGEASRLEFKIDNYLKSTSPTHPLTPSQEGNMVKAIIVPHAGYDFSGQVAAYGYKLLEGKKINTVVIICNSHASYFKGTAVDEHDAWQTPLGLVEVDQELSKKFVDNYDSINFNSEPFNEPDQTLEVQVPFLQTVIKNDFKILPIFFGNEDPSPTLPLQRGGGEASYKELAKALADNLGEDDLIVVSTDMSHYPAYEDAKRVDLETLEMIKTADVSKLEAHISEVESENIANEQTLLCGVDGVKTVMELSNLMKWDKIEVLKYANSGDVEIGDKGSVVGYGAVSFIKIKTTPSPSLLKEGNAKNVAGELDNHQKKELLKIARETVESFVKDGKTPEFDISDERLNAKEGAFVTLHKDGQLRGCIGQIVPSEEPLWQVVQDMAIAACSEDNRFSPVSEKELDKLDYEVSVLSVPEPIDDWQKIELGKHGVIVKKGMHSGVFLPQVATETGWTREEFLSQLCWQKAGLAPDCYKNDPEVELLVYTAQVFSEED
ncbi:MAG: AmmeMemoRadiSam system protein B [Patescibacteria group bacterium]